MTKHVTCVCGHPQEFHDRRVDERDRGGADHGPNCVGGRCGCSGFKPKPTVMWKRIYNDPETGPTTQYLRRLDSGNLESWEVYDDGEKSDTHITGWESDEQLRERGFEETE